MVSVDSRMEQVRKAMALGAKSSLVKPITARKIRQVVDHFLDRGRRRPF